MTTIDIKKLIKKRRMVTVCISVALICGVVYGLRGGRGDELESLRSSRAQQEQILRANVVSSTRLQEQYEAIIAANARILTRMVRASDIARNQQYFYKLETDTGVKLTALAPQSASGGPKAAQKAPYSTVQYACAVQGSFAQILAFLKLMENGQYLTRIRAAVLAPTSGTFEASVQSADPRLALSLTVEFLGEP